MNIHTAENYEAAQQIIKALALPTASGAPVAPRPLSLSHLPRLPSETSMGYGIERVDPSGRVTSRGITDALRWESAPPNWWPHRPWSSSPHRRLHTARGESGHQGNQARLRSVLGEGGPGMGTQAGQRAHRAGDQPARRTGQGRRCAAQECRRRPRAAEHLIGALLARRYPETQTISLVLDDTTANVALFAIAAHADEREAHVREVERSGQNLPEGSYG